MENQGVQTAETIVTPETNTQETTVNESKVTETTPTQQTETPPPEPTKQDKEIAKLKAALDKVTHEAAEAKRNLRAKQTAEEQKAEEERERQEALENELKELRKQSSVANISKRVMSFIQDETVAGTIAEALYGAEDIDTAIDEFNRAWISREKKLKLEYGKIPAPGLGSDDAPKITKEDFAKMSYKERFDLKSKYPDVFQALSK